MQERGRRDDRLRLLSEAHGEREGEVLAAAKQLRPSWTAATHGGAMAYEIGGQTRQVAMTRLERGGRARPQT